MPDIELSEPAEELLAALWAAEEEGGERAERHSAPTDQERAEAARELAEAGLAQESDGELSLTEQGRREARSVIRRERLAERLLADVLNLGEGQVAEAACRFEHCLQRGIDDRICTLLGHPRICPHGRPIPPGDCCREGARAAPSVISALADLTPGCSGAIAYLQTKRRDMLQRLLSMGATPGTPVRVVQTFPSFVCHLGQGQIAVDRETAQDIYIRVSSTPPPARRPGLWPRGLHRFRFRRGRPR